MARLGPSLAPCRPCFRVNSALPPPLLADRRHSVSAGAVVGKTAGREAGLRKTPCRRGGMGNRQRFPVKMGIGAAGASFSGKFGAERSDGAYRDSNRPGFLAAAMRRCAGPKGREASFWVLRAQGCARKATRQRGAEPGRAEGRRAQRGTFRAEISPPSYPQAAA
jgi:hypothetical protein